MTCTHASISGQLSELIAQAHQSSGQRVVVLVDEYDKPILDNITDTIPPPACARAQNLYSVLKVLTST